MGPTACGKTELAVHLAGRLPVEVISVDSALVYRGMDIGTAKPDAATLRKCPHHLIDVIAPSEQYSAARFKTEALALMADITARGRVPLLVGGTMLYFKALKHGLGDLPMADPALRRDIAERAARLGWPALHAELSRLDPAAGRRLSPQDSQRIQRALEVCLLTGKAMTGLLKADGGAALPYRLIEVALMPSDRAVLHRRIDARFRAMLAAGLVEELRALRTRYPLTADLPAMRAVGYRQAWRHLEGEIDAAALFATGAAATRQLAKRQITWLRAWSGAEVFDCLRPDLAAAITAWLARSLAEATAAQDRSK